MRVLILLLLIVCTSCVNQRQRILQDNILSLKNSYCKAPFKYNYSQKIPSYNSDSILLANVELKANFSDQSILLLNALESLDEIHQIQDLKNDYSVEAQLKVLQLKAAINSKITIALTELDAVAAEFDCEGERVAQMAYYVDNINTTNTNRLVYYSIVAGALTSVAGAIVSDDKASNIIDIAGGGLGAGLGFATLNPKGKKVEFIHQRNILKDIWQEKLESENFPPFVWYMYTENHFSNYTEGLSIIGNIKKRWVQFNFENNIERANQSVIFNTGGYYRADDLHNRILMLNQMQSATRTINQIINYLLLDLDRFVYQINH